ncbi:MAG: isopeptide-forming domain-containing fimbrial protein, partial [Gammaproteobacteria bacterium]|nr:isopeptide-forming domain-containing fimbrial protein [Gammaproteobacteria bacterium]
MEIMEREIKNMKLNKSILSVLAFTAMFIILAAPATATENKLYFIPDNSNVPEYGDYVDVDIYTDINESNPAASGQFNIEYDPNCVEDYPSFAAASDWNAVTYSNAPGICYFTTSVGLNDPISGHIKVGTLTLRSNISCGGCFLNFTGASYTGGVIPEIDNGTFLSGDAIEVTKTVWDGSDWVDALGPLGSEWLNNDVRFKITVTAGCLDLSGLVVEDEMDSSLLYNNNANPTETSSTANTATWDIGSLSASTSTSIEFNATIDGYGTSVNTATAIAGVTDLGGIEVSATDQASVTTMPPAGIDVTKMVWDGTAWIEEITDATIGDTYRFRCEMDNSGSPGMDLTNIEVWDVISPGLEYANGAMIMTPNGVWRSIEPPTTITTYDPVEGTTVNWTIDNFLQDPLTLQPGQTFVVEYNATVVDYGYNCNVQYASGYCEAALSYVEGSDTACIDTPEPDMTVTDITVNYDASGVKDLAIGPQAPGTKTQSNNISADISELNGIDVIFPFDVTFKIDGTPVCTVSVSSIGAGNTTTVYCDNEFFPIAGDNYTITVTADSSSDIPETAEGNNSLSETLTAVVNGYKG